ncbi:nitroreductase [Sinobacterium caligoides]|uniref:Putative NAD(P)H nitroreductase n=1 Tax=Sinobacterium caligoides TaxID=933926 RepID=A0A3N2E029_9GAMM|nr:nitroreductase [Sinobacterium caligoides]ROS05059.1 nitroreductase [Sinobacterium caligoides]
MSVIMDALLNRNSSPRLQEPGPTAADCELMFRAALRAPDHSRLRPWRYLQVSGEARSKLGDLYAKAELATNPDATEEKLTRLRNQPLRAPLIIVAIAQLTEHDGVPMQEQVLSAGCGVHGILLAAEALGFAGIWRTGPMATNEQVSRGLGLADNEQVIGFVYVGSRLGEPKALPELAVNDFVSDWS